jgi:hypothetical protein
MGGRYSAQTAPTKNPICPCCIAGKRLRIASISFCRRSAASGSSASSRIGRDSKKMKKLDPPTTFAATTAFGKRVFASAAMNSAAQRRNSSKNAHPYSASIASNCSMSMKMMPICP